MTSEMKSEPEKVWSSSVISRLLRLVQFVHVCSSTSIFLPKATRKVETEKSLSLPNNKGRVASPKIFVQP